MAAPNIIDPREESILPWDRANMVLEYDEGKRVGESCGITELDKIYTMKRGTLSAWTGWANAGKSTLIQFKDLCRAVKYKTKVGIWSHEMVNSQKHNGGVIYSASDLQADLIHMYTGKVPYKHWKAKYGREQMTLKEYNDAIEFLEQHFVFLYIKDRSVQGVIDAVEYAVDVLNCETIRLDPWKNVILPNGGRDDQVLEQALQNFRDFAVSRDIFLDLIVHPKSTQEVRENPKVKNSPFKVVTANMMLGGSTWDNSMDQLISVYRRDGIDPWVTFINLKQKKQHLTNSKGEYDKIEYDFFRNRFYFNGVCPLDGSMKEGQQSKMDFPKPWDKKTKDPFEAPPPTDEPPF